MKKIIAPSLLAADFGNLQRDIEKINRSDAEWLHMDIMDGVFVPNISFGFPILNVAKKYSNKPIDVHCMIVQPERYIKHIADAGAAIMTIHVEACTHLHRAIQEIHAAGMKAGVALNPSTPLYMLEDIIEDVDLVLLMSVNPGFGGQIFIKHALRKIEFLRKMINERCTDKEKPVIEVDGGVNIENASMLFDAGADVLVSGSCIFRSDDYQKTIDALRQ